MKTQTRLPFTLPASVALVTAMAAASGQAALPDRGLPRLQKRGTAVQLVVDGKPFLILGAELNNSSASSLEYMKALWPRS